MCLQCIKSKRTCLGYRDLSDFFFRDETPTTKLKATRTQYRASKAGSTRTPQHNGSNTISRSKHRTQNPDLFPKIPSNTIPKALQESWQQAALCFFLPNFVEIRPREESSRDFMVHLPPLYTNAKPDSTLAAATSALALGALGGTTGRLELKSEAMKQYGIAMARMNRALMDPSQISNDSTLLSILLFGIFEDFTCSLESLPSRGKHAQGAMALIRYRGMEILQDPRSLKLLNAVHYQVLVNHVFRCEPIDTLNFIVTTDNWCEFPALEKDKPANRLTFLTLNLPNLRAAALKIFSMPQCDEKTEKVLKLMEHAKRLDQKLSAWSLDIPESWQYKTVAFVHELDTIETSEAYYGAIHKYPDLWVAFAFNKWRTCMIYTHAIILNCAEWLSTSSHVTRTELSEARNALQVMVDEICASVPFHLGITSGENDEGAFTDPNILGTFAPKLGGYYLLWPLFVAGSVSCIPKSQKLWLKHRLAYIGRGEGQGRSQARVLAALSPYETHTGPMASVTDFLHVPAKGYPVAESSVSLSSSN